MARNLEMNWARVLQKRR